MIKANNFVNILNSTTNIANALGYGGKLFVRPYEFPEGESVLVYTGALPRIAHYVGGVFFDAYAEFDGHIVTHWQTLPKPPQD